MKGFILYLGVECFKKDVFSALILCFLFFSVFAFNHILDRFSVNFKNYYGSLFCYIDNLCCISFTLFICISWPRFVFGFSRYYLNLFYNFLSCFSRKTLYLLLFHGCLFLFRLNFERQKTKIGLKNMSNTKNQIGFCIFRIFVLFLI